MLDTRYLYDCQKSEYVRIHERVKLEYKENLNIKIVPDAYILPIRKSKKLVGDGGICDKDFNPVRESFLSRGAVCLMGGQYDISDETPKYLDEELVYLGDFCEHWGHFLIEHINRLWYAMKHPEKRCFFLLRPPYAKNMSFHLPYVYKRLLELSGINLDNIFFVSEIYKAKCVIIPELSYEVYKYYSSEFLSTLNTIVSNINPTAIESYSKIYFSRTMYKKAQNYEFGLEMIDDIFETDGYKIIYPERDTLDNQIFYINNADDIALISGTLAHNLLFRMRPLDRLYIVNKTFLINSAIIDTLQIRDLQPVYLDFYACKYPVNLGWGPFLIVYNDICKKFITDNSIKIKTSKNMYLEKYLENCVVRYNTTYKAMGVEKLSSTSMPPIALYNNYYKQYSKYEKVTENKDRIGRTLQQLLAEETKLLKCIALIHSKPDTCELWYNVHLSIAGWIGELPSSTVCGYPDMQYKIEAVTIQLKDPNYDVYYHVYYDDSGWDDVHKNGEVAGSVGKCRKIQGIRIWSSLLSNRYDILYRLYGASDAKWHKNGEILMAKNGATALEIKLQPITPSEGCIAQSHKQEL